MKIFFFWVGLMGAYLDNYVLGEGGGGGGGAHTHLQCIYYLLKYADLGSQGYFSV